MSAKTLRGEQVFSGDLENAKQRLLGRRLLVTQPDGRNELVPLVKAVKEPLAIGSCLGLLETDFSGLAVNVMVMADSLLRFF